ncbi:MAG: hypothetical protein L3J35_03870 [Bacteroidales bacterium]|nr:hypothetical protein [Bacteroidales bacterium]
MNKNILILILGVLISSITSCKKDLKLPTDVGFTYDINRNKSADGNLIFTGGTIILAAFDFEGEREQGDDVYFSKSFPGGLSIPFSPENIIPELDFDIPQGVYNRIDISFETFDDLGDNNIVVNGIYTNSENAETPIIFEFKSSEYFSITAEDYTRNSQIILNEDRPVSTEIKLDPIHWFQIISETLFNNAVLVEVDGVMTILINESVNDSMFDLIVDRIDESTEAVFKY